MGCGDQFFAITYFFSYTLVIGMVFLRLFIAIILQTFQDITERDRKFINSELSDHYKDIWALYDPDVCMCLTNVIGDKLRYPDMLSSAADRIREPTRVGHQF
jgi:hypothetical protein